ncbi:hypothetical protein Y1Q_0019914 [Alligator mississippiensis]|uniref:Uncharacterized protein n=1 Tax=Alligator mississippiensis TaxID=8496 RepID=A0A151N0S1_ALLMI|nr:hypothetical protein Y1Q_0019914 [Alligator mississippiensis]
MVAQTALGPYLPSPVSSYQVHSPSWMHHQSYLMQPTGAMLTPALDHAISLQPASVMAPLTQQLGHLSLGGAGTHRGGGAQRAAEPGASGVAGGACSLLLPLQQVALASPALWTWTVPGLWS